MKLFLFALVFSFGIVGLAKSSDQSKNAFRKPSSAPSFTMTGKQADELASVLSDFDGIACGEGSCWTAPERQRVDLICSSKLGTGKPAKCEVYIEKSK